MKLYDKFYGEFDITEPVLLDLLNSPTLLRLKNISQGGYYPAAPLQAGDINRYDHSIGVFLLLRKFGASIEEQIAGLTHDISHSAFSHTIDYIGKDKSSQKNQGHQDSIHNEFIKTSDISNIVKKHGFDIDYILDDTNFPLKENDLPDICADRIDYSIRASVKVPENNIESIHEIIEDLTIYNGQFVFKSFETALKFSNNFSWCNINMWSHPGTAVMFNILGKTLGYAIEKGYISYNDLYTKSDNDIIKFLKNTDDSKLQKSMNKLNYPPEQYLADSSDQDFETTYCKVRNVDPYFLNNGTLTRVSELDKNYSELLKTSPKFLEYKLKAA